MQRERRETAVNAQLAARKAGSHNLHVTHNLRDSHNLRGSCTKLCVHRTQCCLIYDECFPFKPGCLRLKPRDVSKSSARRSTLGTYGEEERDTNAEKSRMKGKNRVSKRYRKKQQNVVDDKKLRAQVKAADVKKKAAASKAAGEREAGGGAEGGGAMPGQTAGAASSAPAAPAGASSALRRFYK